MRTIDVQALHEKINSGETLNLVDVREPSEHSEFNIGGILLPLGDIRVGDTESIQGSRGFLVLPQWKQKRTGCHGSGVAWIYQCGQCDRRNALLEG